jgi:hypothetical protein
MDALALLCTLHADGPATLVRLRAADCATLEHVLAANPGDLSLLLRSSMLAAGRFQKEARQLLDRLEVPLETSSATRRASETRARAAVAHDSDRQPEAPVAAASSAIERVLTAWREADAAEDKLESPRASAPDAAIPVAAVDGLDADTARTLAQVGVRDLAALAVSDELTLSRATGLSYSKVTRLRALARRAVPSAHVVMPRAPLERFSPSERPVVHQEPLLRYERDFVLEPQASEEGVGGPFA